MRRARVSPSSAATTDSRPTARRAAASRRRSAIRDPFVGAIDDAAKQELLARASAYLVCSEHEGFCVPLVEAMRHDLPIVARAFGAVPETLGGAGIAAPPEAGPAELAELLHLAVTDPATFAPRWPPAAPSGSPRSRPSGSARGCSSVLGGLP